MSLRICSTHLWVCDHPTDLGVYDTSFYPAYRYTAENRVLKFAANGRQHLLTFHEAEMSYPHDRDAIDRVREFVRAVSQAERFLYEPQAEPHPDDDPPATSWERIRGRDD